LTLAVKEAGLWPTPRARDYKDGSSVPPSRVKNPELATLGQKVVMQHQTHKTTAKLSPAFVEYLMGFPTGWTNPDISNEQLIKMNTEQTD